MRVVRFDEQLKSDNLFCLGRFDGLHLGHRKLIEKGADIAEKSRLDLSVFTLRPKNPKGINPSPLINKGFKIPGSTNVSILYMSAPPHRNNP